MDAAATLGRFVASHHWEDLPESLRHQGRRALLNFFACALGAAHDPTITAAVATLAPFSGPDRVTVIGRSERLDALNAAFVNAIAGNLLDFDDTHLRTVIHPTAPVAAPALALAEQAHLSGRDLLHAFVLGAEMECRIGDAVSPGHYERGWHITATCGVFGAAAACSRLLRLDAAATEAALAIAASQSAGLVENLATGAKNIGIGAAARGGMLAALFARAGYRGAPQALEGPLGWARAMGDAPDLDAMTGGLGTRWSFAENTYKPYPAGIVLHAVIEAGMRLRERIGDAPIAAVIVRGDQLLLDRGDRPTRNERDARVSIAHAVAAALSRGSARPADFGADAVADPALAALRVKVRAELDASLPRGAAIVRVRTEDGGEHEARVDHPAGSLIHPMTDAALEAKFRAEASEAADARIAAIWSLDRLDDVASLIQAMRPGAGGLA